MLQFGAFCDDGDGVMTWSDYNGWPLGGMELEISYRTSDNDLETMNYHTDGSGLTQWVKFERQEVVAVEGIRVLGAEEKPFIALYELPYCYFKGECEMLPIWRGERAEVGFPDRKMVVVLLDCREAPAPTLTPPPPVTTGLYREKPSWFSSIVSTVRSFLLFWK